MTFFDITTDHFDGLVQKRRNSSALAMELRLSGINQSICLFLCNATLRYYIGWYINMVVFYQISWGVLMKSLPNQCSAATTDICLPRVSGQMELQKHMEDLETALEDIQEGSRDREDELASALDKAERFDNTYQVSDAYRDPRCLGEACDISSVKAVEILQCCNHSSVMW